MFMNAQESLEDNGAVEVARTNRDKAAEIAASMTVVPSTTGARGRFRGSDSENDSEEDSQY
jgi:hypothetical protein